MNGGGDGDGGGVERLSGKQHTAKKKFQALHGSLRRKPSLYDGMLTWTAVHVLMIYVDMHVDRILKVPRVAGSGSQWRVTDDIMAGGDED